MTCNGICHRYKAVGGGTSGRYSIGQSKCVICNGIWIIWKGTFCPCCHYKLRKNPRKRTSIKVRM